MTTRGTFFLVTMFVIFCCAPTMHADDTNLARDAFERGTHALEEGRFTEAKVLLRTSLQIAPRAATAFNLAVALRGSGEPVQALQLFDQLHAGVFGPLSLALQRQVTTLRSEAESDVAVLEITVHGPSVYELRLDGSPTPHHGSARQRVNPGRHIVSASARGFRVMERVVEVARGDVTRMALRLTPVIPPALLTVSAVNPLDMVEIVGVTRRRGSVRESLAPGFYRIRVIGSDGIGSSRISLRPSQQVSLRLESPGGSLLEQPWFWIAAGALAVGAVAVTWVATSEPKVDAPITDPVFDRVETLNPP